MVVPDTAIVNVMLPQMQRALGFSGTGLEWVVNAYALTFGGLMLLGGRAGDLLGRRKMFITGLGVFTAASLAGGLAAPRTLAEAPPSTGQLDLPGASPARSGSPPLSTGWPRSAMMAADCRWPDHSSVNTGWVRASRSEQPTGDCGGSGPAGPPARLGDAPVPRSASLAGAPVHTAARCSAPRVCGVRRAAAAVRPSTGPAVCSAAPRGAG